MNEREGRRDRRSRALSILVAVVLAACGDARETAETPSGKQAAGAREQAGVEKAEPAPLPPAQPMPRVKPSDVSKAITTPESGRPIMPDELMVLLREGETEASFVAATVGLQVKVVGAMPLFRMLQVEVPADRREELKGVLENLPPVESVTYQSVGKTFVPFNDPVFINDDPRDDWNLKAINAPAAWEVTRGHPNVAVAILDGGTLVEHEELEGKIVRPASGLSADGVSQVLFEIDHGTHVAITAGGADGNGRGTAGVCPACSILPVQINLTLAQTAAALEYVIRNGARVVNMSYGPAYDESLLEDFAKPGARSASERAMMRRVRDDRYFVEVIMEAAEASGVVMVPAAGNSALPGAFFPLCRHPKALCVGAAGMVWEGPSTGRIAPAGFSNYGFYVDVAAPGVDILSGVAGPGRASYASWQGTSMAAPHVSGLAGLLFSFNPDLKARDVRRIIRASARFGNDPDRPGVRWYADARMAEREVTVWRRAALRLLGKDETKLLPKAARVRLVERIPRRWNAVRDWPYENGGQKSIGPFIDARAALEMARRGDVDRRFAEFSDADLKALDALDPDRLVALADMLRLEGRYAGGQIEGGFRLILGPEGDRLVVERDLPPDKPYREAFVYAAPGRYRHEARYGEEDFGRGPVRLRRREGSLLVEDLIAGKELAYAPR